MGPVVAGLNVFDVSVTSHPLSVVELSEDMTVNNARGEVVAGIPFFLEGLERLVDVEKRTGLKRSEIYKQAKSGSFPRPVRIGTRAVAWKTSEVNAWIAALPYVDQQ